MKRILLVDDEPMVRHIYRTILPWEEHGFEIRDVASGGSEALEKLKTGTFDILVTDIRMPGIDGLSLIERACELYPSLAVVVLSSYDDYLLVRKAFTLGASDYFIKALSEPEELLEVIRKVSAKQDRLEEEKSYTLRLGKIERRQAMLAVLTSKPADPLVLEKGEEYLQTLIADAPYCMVSISVEKTSENRQSIIDTFRSRLSSNFSGELFEITPEKLLCLHVDDASRRLTAYDPQQRLRFIASVRKFYTDLLIMLKKQSGITFSAGISSVYSRREAILSATRESEQVLSFRFASGKGSILSPDILSRQQSEEVQEEQGTKRPIVRIVEAFMLADRKRMFSLIDEHEQLLRRRRCDKAQVLHEFYFPLYMRLYVLLKDKGYDARVLSGEERYMLETLSDALTLDDMHSLFRDWLETLMRSMRSSDDAYTGDVVLKARMYIDEHYCEPLRLEQLARVVAVHPNYLSRLFTERMGTPLFTYINELRVNRSKRQLRSTDMKIYEIAYANGFDSPEYYCRIFKRVTGLSPNKYRSLKEPLAES